MKILNRWQIYAMALVFMTVGISCHGGDPNKSVNSNDPGEQSGRGITQGVSGQITVPGGRPVSGALIQPKSLDERGPPIPEIAILTDENGWYKWPLAPGMYEITASAEGYRPTTKQIIVRVGKVVIADLTLERTP